MDNKKLYINITIGLVIFALTTILVLSSDTSSRKKVGISNRNVVLNNENSEIQSENVSINMNNSKISNQSVDFNSKNINTNNQQINVNNNGSFNNQESRFSNNNYYNNQKTRFENQQTEYDPNLVKYQNQQNELKRIQNEINNPKPQDNYDQYVYQNINWNKWKSNFVNKIIDDSMYIKSLDEYPMGSMFYYSFIVTATGEIHNVKVHSIHLSTEDKIRVANLIKNYAHTPITKFPPNSRRASAKVEANVMLGPQEEKSRPSDFNDIEHIKIILPH